MNDIIDSHFSLKDDTMLDYKDCITDIFFTDEVQKLDDFHQHAHTSRLKHSLNVSYYSYLVCKALKFDFKSAARAGLLHDLFLYDWRVEKQPEGRHAFAHPKVALRNATALTELNDIEKDAILNHMFPLTITFPKYKESYVVTLVDKYCAVAETVSQLKNVISKKFRKDILQDENI